MKEVNNFCWLKIIKRLILFIILLTGLCCLKLISTPYVLAQNIVTLEGELEVLTSDNFEKKISAFLYFLKTADGERFPIYFNDKNLHLQNGMQVQLTGQLSAGEFFVDSTDVKNLQVLTDLQPQALAVKTVAVILFNFQNDLSEPYPVDEVKTSTFTNTDSIAAYYDEASYNQWEITSYLDPINGDVFGWYTINSNNDPCDYINWLADAQTLAVADGYHTANYTNTILVFPKTDACVWDGLAQLPGSIVFINSNYYYEGVVAHELGHNYGVHHATSLTCHDEQGNRVPISNNCQFAEYGDPFDVMGAALYNRHFSNYHKDKLSWLLAENMQTVTENGYYSVTPIEFGDGINLVRVPREKDSFGNPIDYYYIEFRQPYGFDDFLATDPVVNGISIRIAPGEDYRSYLIDTTSATTTFLDSALLLNQTFTDNQHNISIKTINVTTTEATFYVELSSPGFSPGDVNHDLLVNIEDARLVLEHFSKLSWPSSVWPDANNDNTVNVIDFGYVIWDFGL